MLRCVQDINEIEELWPRIKAAWMMVRDKEVALDVVSPADTLKSLLLFNEILFLWEVNGEIESIVIGQFVDYPRLKVFRLNSLSGKLGEHWASALSSIEQWALSKGAQGFEFWGRPGLGKFLSSQGYHLGMQHFIKGVEKDGK